MMPGQRWRLSAAGAVALLLACTAPAPAQKTTIYRSLTPERIEQILDGMNIKYKKTLPKDGSGVTLKDEYDYDFDRNNYKIRFTLSKGKLLWLSAVFPKAPLETINNWNVQAKFSRAVLDRSGDREFAVVESQIDAAGGVTVEIIRHFIVRFDDEVARFDQFLKK
jgi:Putative bacterial sensory transduction regulator